MYILLFNIKVFIMEELEINEDEMYELAKTFEKNYLDNNLDMFDEAIRKYLKNIDDENFLKKDNFYLDQ